MLKIATMSTLFGLKCGTSSAHSYMPNDSQEENEKNGKQKLK